MRTVLKTGDNTRYDGSKEYPACDGDASTNRAEDVGLIG